MQSIDQINSEIFCLYELQEYWFRAFSPFDLIPSYPVQIYELSKKLSRQEFVLLYTEESNGFTQQVMIGSVNYYSKQ